MKLDMGLDSTFIYLKTESQPDTLSWSDLYEKKFQSNILSSNYINNTIICLVEIIESYVLLTQTKEVRYRYKIHDYIRMFRRRNVGEILTMTVTFQKSYVCV